MKRNRELIELKLKNEPEKSDRQIAKELGISHPTVAVVRRELERRDVEKFTTSLDTLGRKQPRNRSVHKPAVEECLTEGKDEIYEPAVPPIEAVQEVTHPCPLRERHHAPVWDAEEVVKQLKPRLGSPCELCSRKEVWGAGFWCRYGGWMPFGYGKFPSACAQVKIPVRLVRALEEKGYLRRET